MRSAAPKPTTGCVEARDWAVFRTARERLRLQPCATLPGTIEGSLALVLSRVPTRGDLIARRRAALAALVASTLVILASPAHALAAGEIPSALTIASEGARPPYNYLDHEKLAGFEIDLAADLCRRMAVTCSFVAQDWDDMIPGLLAHRYDAIMAAMEITKVRRAQIAFSIPYVRMPSAFLVPKDTDIAAATPNAMAGRRIGVEAGGPHEVFLARVYPQARIKRYGSLGDAILDLEAGRVDAAIGDKDAIVTFLETRRDAACCRILADVPRDAIIFGEGIGIGLREEDVALKAAFDKALAACLADGAFARISGRYFNFSID